MDLFKEIQYIVYVEYLFDAVNTATLRWVVGSAMHSCVHACGAATVRKYAIIQQEDVSRSG